MTIDVSNISDEELTAYLDGELARADNAKIEAALSESPDLRARLDALRIPMGALQEAFDAMLENTPDMPALKDSFAPYKKAYAQRVAGLAAALVIGLIVGAGALRQDPEPKGITGWMQYVAAYQALYVTETLDVPGFVANKGTLDSLSERLGVNLDVADAAPDLEYRRAQILGFSGKDLVQIAYLAEGGVPVALCVIRTTKEGSSAPTSREFEGMQAASWHANGFEYLLIGGDNPALINKAAQEFSAVL